MSLPSKATSVNFAFQDAGTGVFSHQLDVSRLSHPFEMVLWKERKGLSITGKKRKANIVRGYDARIVLEWDDVRGQETDIKNFIDDLKVASDNDYDIRFSVVGDTSRLFVIPMESVFNQNYTNQVSRRTPVRMEFEIVQLKDDITYDGTTP